MDVLTFDDEYTLDDFDMKNMQGNEQELFGSITSKTVKIPGKKGLYDFGNEVGSFSEKFPVIVLAKTEVERSYKIRAFKQFILDEFGYPRIIKIQKSLEPDVYYWGKIAVAPVPKLYSTAATFILEIVSLDGMKYSNVSADEILWGSKKISFQAGYRLGNTGTGANALKIVSNTSINSFVEGSAVKPEITIIGAGTNVKITCGNRVISIGTFSNQTIKIDTEMFVAYFNGSEKIIEMDDFYIMPNQKIVVTGTNMNFSLTIKYRDVL